MTASPTTNPRPLRLRFVPMGAQVEPAPGQRCLDVGNRLAPGVIDHHQPDAPARCTAALVLERPELVLAPLAHLAPDAPLTIVTHRYIELLADNGLAEACRLQPALAGGINVQNGRITCKAVADAHGLKFTPPQLD